MTNKISENTQVQLDLKTIGIIVTGAVSIASVYFALQSDIELAKQLPEPEIKKSEYELKDELVRTTIININEKVNKNSDKLDKIDEKLLYVNSSWNKSNDYKHLSTLKNVRVLKVNYDDQPKKFREQVKSVPAIILFDENNKLKRVWQGGLSMSLNVDPKDIQAMVNKIINEKK